MSPSTLTTKNVEIRANDYSTSSSSIVLKTYDLSSSYTFYMPDKNPKFLDGVSGSEQVADQVLTYDVASDKYVWKQASGNDVFLQGQTDTIGSDEHGNVMTILSETRVTAGDPFYDPSKSDSEQVYKAQYQFTDQLYNMKNFSAGKKSITTQNQLPVSQITHAGTTATATLAIPITEVDVSQIVGVGTTATATLASGHGISNGDSVTVSGTTVGAGFGFPDPTAMDVTLFNQTVTVSNVTATTFEYTLTQAISADNATASNTGIKASFTPSNPITGTVVIAGVTGTDSSLYNGTFTAANITATTFDFTLSSAPSADVSNAGITTSYTKTYGVAHDKTSGLYFEYANGVEPAGTKDEKKQALDKVTIQTKKATSGSNHAKVEVLPLETTFMTVDSGDATKSAVKLTQSQQELSFSDSSKFLIDNSTKKVAMDMETIEFGPSANKHRFSISNQKLFIQKWDSNNSSWVGADVVIDTTVIYTSTISITASNTVSGKIDVTATLGGTYDHWHVKLDDGSESMVTSGTTFQLDSTYIGTHQVVAYSVDASHTKISEYAIFSITTTQ